MGKKTILVICNGNIHRSAIAERCLARAIQQRGLGEEFLVLSRGLQGTGGTALPRHFNLRDYPLEWKLSEPVLDKLGIDLSGHVAKPVSEYNVAESSIILAMDRKTLIYQPNSLVVQFPAYGFKMRLFRELEGKTEDVPDCAESDNPDLHEHVIGLINRVSQNYVEVLIEYACLFTATTTKGECLE